MNIIVQIQLGVDEYAGDLSGNATEIAEKILVAVGGDPAKDIVSVQINDSGSAGAILIPPIPEPIPEPPTLVTVNSTFATTNSAPPGDKQTRTNTAVSTDATAIYIDKESTEGNDLSVQLLALMIGDSIDIRSVSDASRYASFGLMASPIDQGTFVELPVAHTTVGDALTNGACTLTFPTRP